MTVKEYLGQIRKFDIKIKTLEEEVSNLNERKFAIKSPVLTESINDNHSNKAMFERAVSECDEKVGELLETQIKAINTRHLIYTQLTGLDNVYFEILYARYFKQNRWEQIAVDLNYGVSHLHRLHGQALQEFKNIVQIQ